MSVLNHFGSKFIVAIIIKKCQEFKSVKLCPVRVLSRFGSKFTVAVTYYKEVRIAQESEIPPCDIAESV